MRAKTSNVDGGLVWFIQASSVGSLGFDGWYWRLFFLKFLCHFFLSFAGSAFAYALIAVGVEEFPLFGAVDGIASKIHFEAIFYVSRDKDVDNMTKLIVDVLQSAVYRNDIEVQHLILDKYHTTSERARIKIRVTHVVGTMMEIVPDNNNTNNGDNIVFIK